jgi:hypothetical protein
MSDSMQGNQTFAGASRLLAALPKTFVWLQKVVDDFGQRLSKKLRTTNSFNGREDDPEYFGM